ncbi:MAG: T9SS type A sorting domain-containing protein [Saprospiraceae bacterium]
MKRFLLVLALLWGGLAVNAQRSAKVDLTVYPNPTIEFISVQDNNDVVGFLAVYNIVGRKLKEFEFAKGDQYSLLDLPKGMYLVQIQDRNRHIITTQKIDKR